MKNPFIINEINELEARHKHAMSLPAGKKKQTALAWLISQGKFVAELIEQAKQS